MTSAAAGIGETVAAGGGPLALLFVEDGCALGPTLRHHEETGFGQIVALAAPGIDRPDLPEGVAWIGIAGTGREAVAAAVTEAIAAAGRRWIYWGFNAEFLYHPFRETRPIGAFCTFLESERREAALAHVVDLYPETGRTLDPDAASFDGAGYFAEGRIGPDGAVLDRQKDIFGGLRRRYEELVPEAHRRIDRPALFRAAPGLVLGADFLLSDPERNTYACPWHHSPTVAVASFRAAKALLHNPASRDRIGAFGWRGSVPFRGSSVQLMEHGLMEPGQWA